MLISQEINESSDSITLENDYKYNNETDKNTKYIEFKNKK